MPKHQVYSGEGLEAPDFVIDAAFSRKFAEGEVSEEISNAWWWTSQMGPKRSWKFTVYVNSAELARKIEKSEGVKAATCQNGFNAPVHGWHFTIAYRGKRHLNKILRWCGLTQVPRESQSEKQKQALINTRKRLDKNQNRELITSCA